MIPGVLFLNDPLATLPVINIVEKVWGREYWMVNNDKYCLKVLHLEPGYYCSLHYHEIKDETFIVMTGTVHVEYDYDYLKNHRLIVKTLTPGTSFHLPPYTAHRFCCEDVPANILEVSTFHSDDDVVRLQESRKI